MLPRFPLLVLMLCIGSAQAFLPYSDPLQSRPRRPAWDSRVTALWEGWKSRYLGSDGIVRGTSIVGDSASSSRAQADGLLLSIWMGDQPSFDKIWRAAEDSLWDSNRGFFRRSKLDSNFRGDAEMDICAALVFASALADSGYWTGTILGGKTYRARAKDLIVQDLQGKVLDPSTKLVRSWAGAGDRTWSSSYQTPQWIPILEAFALENGVLGTDWKSFRRAGHALLIAQPGSKNGMVRNFSGAAGEEPVGVQGFPSAKDMGLDAVRVPFQLALAIQWHRDSLAMAWSDTVWSADGVDPSRPGLYILPGGTLWKWCGEASCGKDAAYQSFLPRSQWGSLAVAGSLHSATAQSASLRIVADFDIALRARAGSLASEWSDSLPLGDPALDGYAQTLGLFGALVMSGRALNVWGDLRDPRSPRDSFLLERLTATPESLALSVTGSAPVARITARFAQPKRWILRLVGRSSGARFAMTDSGSVVDVEWGSKQSTGSLGPKFVAELVDAVLSFEGADTLGDPRNRTTILLRASTSTGPGKVRPGIQTRVKGSNLFVKFSGDHSEGSLRLRVLDVRGSRMSPPLRATPTHGSIAIPLDRAPSGILLLEGCAESRPGDCWRMVVPAP